MSYLVRFEVIREDPRFPPDALWYKAHSKRSRHAAVRASYDPVSNAAPTVLFAAPLGLYDGFHTKIVSVTRDYFPVGNLVFFLLMRTLIAICLGTLF